MDTTITDVVYMDVGLCFEGVRQDRTLGDKALCTSTQPLGRIVMGDPAATPSAACSTGFSWFCREKRVLSRRRLCIAGLYGRALPQTVANFLTLVKSGAYSGTAFTKACAITRHPSSGILGLCQPIWHV